MKTKAWIKVGAKVRYLEAGRPAGERVMGEGKPTAWLLVGALGTVTELHTGYPEHRCPDHGSDPDCVCGGEGVADRPGWVRANPPWATVEFETDVPGRVIKRAIDSSEEGKGWERVRD